MKKTDCYFYSEFYDMGAHISCCTFKEYPLGKCPCDNCTNVVQERYEDLCEYFGGAKDILNNREDFKAWLGRIKWHIHKAEELYEKYEQEPKWIPVSERLPKDEQEVLITYKINGKHHVWSGIWDKLRGKFYDKKYSSYISLDYVTAWMPLPKPYEPQERSDKE